MLRIFFLRNVGLRYRRVQGNRKETTALRKRTVMGRANFSRIPTRLIITFQKLLASSLAISAAYSFISYIYVYMYSRILHIFNFQATTKII